MTRRLHALLRRVWFPWQQERQLAISRAWEDLPEGLRSPLQALGRQNAGCAAVFRVMDRCDFSCDACYMNAEDDSAEPASFSAARSQLDAIREHLGPWGNVQLSGGEITLLPVNELVRLVRCCREIELDAIVMSHGETFRRTPEYLERLVLEGGLRKVAIHVDTTQRGRPGWTRPTDELALHPLRDEMAELIRSTRARTGQPLSPSHTVTVTDRNIDDVPEIVRWMVDNCDAFHLVSFQPAVAVGRTRILQSGVAQASVGAHGLSHIYGERLWRLIGEGLGQPTNPHAFEFGHPACSEVALMFVVRFGQGHRVVQVHRPASPPDRRFMSRLLGSRLGGFVLDGEPLLETVARLLGILLRDPGLPASAAAYCLYRAATERGWLPELLWAVASGKPWSVHTLSVVVHNFMSPKELATPRGRERLEACAFRLPVEGRMVPMCRMNAVGRGSLQQLKSQTG